MSTWIERGAIGIGVVATVISLSGIHLSARETVGFEGRFLYRNGNTVDFSYLGTTQGPGNCRVSGEYNGQNVSYYLDELKSVHFLEQGRRYSYKTYRVDRRSEKADVEIVGNTGERALLRNAYISSSREYGLDYVYNDPISGTRKQTYLRIEDILAIEVGSQAGTLKYNPKDKRYYPPYYIYDPYDGSKLVWAYPVE